VTPEAEGYLAALAGVLRERLGDGLIGAYLHGSAVLGGWHPERSDVDVLAVCAGPVGAGKLGDLAAAASVRRARSRGSSSTSRRRPQPATW
jgi:predicted nucleotidyltransferase